MVLSGIPFMRRWAFDFNFPAQAQSSTRPSRQLAVQCDGVATITGAAVRGRFNPRPALH
jgi:hypothetical protein